jgi:glycosyltransferase involved in cell wall biosynthesis
MRIVYLCGALDEATRRARRIDAANLAATQKVFNFCRALRRAGHHASVLSLGRGRQNGSGEAHAARARRADGVAVIYARFVHTRWTTHLVSAFSAAALVWRLHKRGPARDRITLIAYNRLWHYVPALVLARVLGMRCFLDLEDGFVTAGRATAGRIADKCGARLFDLLCSRGALLANTALAAQTSLRHRTVWYGVLPAIAAHADWTRTPLGVMFGGTLHEERGCRLFMDAVKSLMQSHPALREQLRFHVTGHGPMQAELAAFARDSDGWVTFSGLAERAAYLELLGRSHVGLMLNLSSHEMSRTTFPSKVLEYAAAGLLVVSTPVSDVPRFFGAGAAMLLTAESPAALAKILAAIAADPQRAAAIAAQGTLRAHENCAAALLAPRLASFLGGDG